MGCHSQSLRLLLDMLAEGDGPAECYYGLALNQLGMNDVPGARRMLGLYTRREPDGAHLEEVRRLAAELDYYSEMNRSASRKLRRAARRADHGCEAMRSGDAESACRLFEQSLQMASEQYEMRALYAMALFMNGDAEAARLQAERASSGYPPSVRALCVSAQVYALLGDGRTARSLIDRAAEERPEGQELRLMIYAMGELKMHDRVAEFARLALQETPFDRDLLHIRAVALAHTGTPDRQLERFWARILRIDPDDSIARFYQEAAHRGALSEYTLEYGYQVPREEFRNRFSELVSQLGMGFEHVSALWQQEADFRQLVEWAVRAEDGRLSRAAVTALTAIDSTESRSVLRELLFTADVPMDLKLHATLALRLQGKAPDAMLPGTPGIAGEFMPDAEAMLSRLGVGERQLVRYTAEVMEDEYGISAMLPLTLLWSAYRQTRGTRVDPLRCIAGASAALAYNYLLVYGPKPRIDEVCRAFRCPRRQMIYYARRIAGCLEKIGELTVDENP